MPQAGSGDYSPDSTQMVYSPQSRDFRPEKRYGGGQANSLYIFDLKTYATKRITEGPRATRDPIWMGNTIYFNSDRDGHFNLYAFDVPTGKTTQITSNKVWDVRWPSSDNQDRIIYELNGELQVLDTKSVVRLSQSTFPTMGWHAGLVESLPWARSSQLDLAPKASSSSQRGATSSVPRLKKAQLAISLTRQDHDKWPSWSPDGSKIAFISDMSGEEELYVIPQDGLKPAEQITRRQRLALSARVVS